MMRGPLEKFRVELSSGGGTARRRGYVLVVTLGLLVLSAGLLVGISRASMGRAAAARLAEQDLQRRWATATCRDSVLPYAGQILEALEKDRHRPQPSFRTSISLGGHALQVVIADEQAKLDVNAMLAGVKRETAENRLRGVMSGSGLGNRLRLRPGNEPAPRALLHPPSTQPDAKAPRPVLPVTRWVTGFGQIFDGIGPEQLAIRPKNASIGVGDLLTCWGGGSLNVRRAPAEVLNLVLDTGVDRKDIQDLIESRAYAFAPKTATFDAASASKKDVPLPLGLQIRKLLPARAAARLLKPGEVMDVALAETSTCYSLWIVAQDHARYWYTFDVMDNSDDRYPRRTSLAW